MRVRFACAACEETVATGDITLPLTVSCPRCRAATSFARPTGAAGTIERCPACGGRHLFLQKEFPRRLGLAITIIGAVIFLVLMGFERIVLGFGVLLGVALIDAILYRLAPLMTVCYHCQTEFRRGPASPAHGAYDPKIAFYTAKKGRPGRIEENAPDMAEAPRPGGGEHGETMEAAPRSTLEPEPASRSLQDG